MTFDPTNFGFIPINYNPPHVVHFERAFEGMTSPGQYDFLRLNVYLTKSDDYVTIWFGLLEPFMAEAKLENADPSKLAEFDFHESYNTELFKGHIENDSVAAVILSAILGRSNSFCPQQIVPVGDGWSCGLLPMPEIQA